MLRIFFVAALFCSLALSGCGSAKPRTQSAPPPPDSTGVFVDACRILIDSVKVEKDRIIIYDGEFPGEYEETDRAGDTVFHAGGVMAFIRRNALPPAVGHEYFYGYNHRGNRHNWAGSMFMQVRPRSEVAEGWLYARGSDPGKSLTCVPYALGRTTAQVNQAEPADASRYDFPPYLTVANLGRLESLKERYMEMVIDWRSIPELSQYVGMEHLEEKLRVANETNQLRVKHFYACGMEHGLAFIPLYRFYLEQIRLTDRQLLELGATLKSPAQNNR